MGVRWGGVPPGPGVLTCMRYGLKRQCAQAETLKHDSDTPNINDCQHSKKHLSAQGCSGRSVILCFCGAEQRLPPTVLCVASTFL